MKSFVSALLTFAVAAILASGAEIFPCGLASAADAVLSADVPLVENGKIDATIMLPLNVRKSDAEAANFLADSLAKIAYRGSVEVHWFRASQRETENGRIAIFLEPDSKVRKAVASDGDFTETNIFSVSADEDKIRISYPRDADAMAAVGIFLTEFCGANFFAPSSLGEDLPKLKNLTVPRGVRSFKPSYEFFDFSLGSRGSNMWRRLAGAGRMPSFSHNLGNVLGEKFASGWNRQPDFVAPEAVETGADFAERFFLRNPSWRGISLTIEDTQRVPPSVAALKDGYFRSYPNYSPPYFRFAGNVAAKIVGSNPAKFVGTSAYLICQQYPELVLPYNVFPMLCADRTNYAYPDYRDGDRSLMEAWSGSGVRLWGIYDYAYGSCYPAPREVGKFLAEGIKTSHSLGARAYYAEMYPIWAYDAKKNWIISRLANDVSLDYSALEELFYRRYYGAAAEAAKRFYGIAERVWSGDGRTAGAPAWLAFYKVENGADIFSREDFFEMEKALDEMLSLSERSGDAKVSARAGELALAFSVTKAAMREHYAHVELYRLLNSGASAIEISQVCAEVSEGAADKRAALAAYAKKSAYPNANWDTAIGAKSFAEDFASLELARMGGAEGSRLATEVLRRGTEFYASPKKDDILRYGGFERPADAEGNFPAVWGVYSLDKQGLVARISKRAARTGRYGAEFVMCEQTGISQFFSISQGKNCLFEGWIKSACALGASPYATLVFLDANGVQLERRTFIIPSSTDGKFMRFVISGTAPRGSASVGAAFFAARMRGDDTIFADDFSVYIY